MSQQRQRSVRATPDGIERLLAAKGSSEYGRLSNFKIADRLQISERTVARFFRGKGVDKENAYAIVKFLGLSNEEVLSSEDILVEETIRQIESEKSINSDRARELIEGLETSLNDLKKSEEDCFPAMDWLKANRRPLSREAAEFVLRKNCSQSFLTTDESDIDQFSKEIRKYLQAVHSCLELGTWEVIESAIQEAVLPMTKEIKFYTEALTFIKDQRVSQNLPPDSAQWVVLCLEYLINILPIRF